MAVFASDTRFTLISLERGWLALAVLFGMGTSVLLEITGGTSLGSSTAVSLGVVAHVELQF